MNVAMVAMQKDFAKLEEMVNGFQQINMAMRYAPVPVVTATQGYVFGGGCEILMHTDAAVCHAESYIGLVEVGVGLDSRWWWYQRVCSQSFRIIF
jgi:3-hydroxyacyl-CoA dehydrogenase